VSQVIRVNQPRWWHLAIAGLLIGALPLLAACGGGSASSSGSARAVASSIAANPSLKADEQAAAKLIQGCLTLAHVSDVKGCLLGKVSPDARKALGSCLAKAAASVVGQHDAKAKFGQGAQACVATALAVGGSVSPLASIPGVTVTPSVAVTVTPRVSTS